MERGLRGLLRNPKGQSKRQRPSLPFVSLPPAPASCSCCCLLLCLRSCCCLLLLLLPLLPCLCRLLLLSASCPALLLLLLPPVSCLLHRPLALQLVMSSDCPYHRRFNFFQLEWL